MREFNHCFESYNMTAADLHKLAYALEEAGIQNAAVEIDVFDEDGEKWIKFLKGIDKRYGWKRDVKEYESHRSGIITPCMILERS